MAHDNNEKRGNDNNLLRWIGRFILVMYFLFSVLNMDFISSIVSSTFLNSSSEKTHITYI